MSVYSLTHTTSNRDDKMANSDWWKTSKEDSPTIGIQLHEIMEEADRLFNVKADQ